VHLVWIDVSQSVEFAFEPMAADVDSLLGKVGVDVAWTRAGPSMSVTADTFRVILLGSEGPRPWGKHPVMGSVMPGPSPPPTVWIDLPNVLSALGLQKGASQTFFEKRDIGRALARVIVHELVHVVLPARPHSRSGLLAAQLGRDVLLWPGTEIEPALAAPFLAGLAAWPTRPDVPKAAGGTLDGAVTSMNLKPSEHHILPAGGRP
jgi:hypothetical protein